MKVGDTPSQPLHGENTLTLPLAHPRMVEIRLDYTTLRQMSIVADDAAKLAQQDELEQQHMNAIADIGKKIGTNLEGSRIVTGAIWSPGSADEHAATTIEVSPSEAQAYVDAVNAVGASAAIDRQHEYPRVIQAFTL